MRGAADISFCGAGPRGSGLIPSREKGRVRALVRAREVEREENTIVFLLLVCLVCLPIAALSSLKTPLYAAILALDLLLLLVASAGATKMRLDGGLVWTSVGLFCYLIICWLLNGGSAAERLVQTAVYLATLLAFSSYEWTAARVSKVKRLFAALLFAALVYWFVSGRVTNYYAAFYVHSNAFAVVLICACALSLLSMDGPKPKVSDLCVFAMALVLLLFANSRSAMLALLVVVALPYLLHAVSKKRSFLAVARVAFFVVLVAVLAFTVVYPSLIGTQLGYSLEMLSREWLNKNFFSGREVVWKMILDAVKGHEVFGLGLSMVPSMVYETSFSSHNLYLQTILQSGAVGLVFVLLLLWLVLERLGKEGGWQACVGASLLVGVLVHECLEVSLTQNNFDVGLLFWVVLGISVSASSLRTARGGDGS